MLERLDRAWRLGATAFCFFLFGAGAVLVWGLAFPVVTVFLGRGLDRKRRARRLMTGLFRFFIGVMCRSGLMEYRVEGIERLNLPGRLVVANHPSLIDVVLLISLIRNATCVVKPAAARNPFLRLPIEAVGYLYAEDPETLLDRCAEELREGGSLIVFPEGTRTPLGVTRPFQRGAANIALQAGAAILPVYIRCQPSWLTREHRWHYVPPSRVRYRLHAGEDLDPAPFAAGGERALAARRLTRRLRQHFTEQEALHGQP